jgi:hypothetical protein
MDYTVCLIIGLVVGIPTCIGCQVWACTNICSKRYNNIINPSNIDISIQPPPYEEPPPYVSESVNSVNS